MPAVEKLVNVLLLARGGELPDVDEEVDWKKNKNQYAQLFRDMFGIHWRTMISLHKMLTLSTPDLIFALGLMNGVEVDGEPVQVPEELVNT